MTEPQYLRSEAAPDSGHPALDIWRKEIHSRVSRFRTRRGRRIEGAFSMRFPFPPLDHLASAIEAEVQAESPECDIHVAEMATATAPPPIVVAATEPPELTAEPIAAAE